MGFTVAIASIAFAFLSVVFFVSAIMVALTRQKIDMLSNVLRALGALSFVSFVTCIICVICLHYLN